MQGIKFRRVVTPLAALIAIVGLAFSPVSDAKDSDDGIPIEVRVMDPSQNPVATAVVRHPEEEERHRVNTVTGSWVGSILYLPDGSMLKFEKGMNVRFEISAPGYVTETVHYVVRKRKNVIEVMLEPMEVEEEIEEEMPIIGFGRDKPIGGLDVQ
ncbi:MAG: hypothetical protein JRI25_14075 [Deltaproteobacteria bacterium]|nr:hypothetical protein [Deltaproteobacteria bacterium]MBW2255712.1 hypothetical protein [Deltaproteobacteria bacterium]